MRDSIAVSRVDRPAIEAVLAERCRQDARFGTVDVDPGAHVHRQLVVLGEEFGEACQAALAQKATDKQDLRQELVQVAAVAVKMIAMGDHHGWWGRRASEPHGDAASDAQDAGLRQGLPHEPREPSAH